MEDVLEDGAVFKIAFLLKASQAATSPIFSPRSLASLGGRMDLVARSIIAAFSAGSELRRKTAFLAVLEGPPRPPILLVARGDRLGRAPSSELEVGELILRAFNQEVEGLKLAYGISFEKIVKGICKRVGSRHIAYLERWGKDVRSPHADLTKHRVFILGDHRGLDRKSKEFLAALGIRSYSLGPLSYLTSHCITLVLEEFERKTKNY